MAFYWLTCVMYAGRLKVSRGWREFNRFDVLLFLGLYAALAVASFMLSGRAKGGHWMTAMEQAFAADTRFIIVANFSNVFRAAAFGLLIYATSRSIISKTQAVAIGGALALFDTVVTFNRITLAYWAVSSMIILRQYFLAAIPAVVISAPIASYALRFWSTFRGLALNDGFTLSGINKAFLLSAGAHSDAQSEIGSILNSLFEASNLLVFSWIVKAMPESFSPLWGETMIGRPLTVFVPSTLWPDKPAVFGTRLGDQIQGVHGLSLNSTLIGECYANFYFFWPFALLAALMLMDACFRLLSTRSSAYGFLGAMLAFACWRFDYSFAAISLVALVSFEFLRNVIGSRGKR